MRNGTKYTKKFITYVLDCIDDVDNENFHTKTKREKVEFMRDRFYSEKDWEIKRYNRHKACVSWLQGLCSTVPVAFENYRIIEIAKKWGYLNGNPTETEEDRVLDKWWGMCATAVIKLIDALDTKTSKYLD